MARFFLFLFVVLFGAQTAYSALSGGVDYKIPIDYANLNEQELVDRADFYYDKALNSGAKLTDDMTSALNLYTILKNKSPENVMYPLKLGKLYEVLGKDRYARGNYYQAMGIDGSRPEPYFYLGDYFYKRSQYRKALKMYIRAQEHGYAENSGMQEKMDIIRKKLGL